jgi:hypothetical protein
MTFLLLLLAAAAADTDRDQAAQRLIQEISASGRVVEILVRDSDRVTPMKEIAPGAPPLLSFRYFEGKDRHRFGRLDLVMDDAGH